MRASFQQDLTIQDSYQLRGDAAHHLVNVVRIELGEEILLLNGAGLRVKTKVSSLSKREVLLEKLEHSNTERTFHMDLALGIPKKDALELSLKQAVELGFRKIFLVRSQYSQTKLPETERIMSLLISALEQSNSSYLPEIHPVSWDEIPAADYNEILLMDSQHETKKTQGQKMAAALLVVGPEGGFSPEESAFLHQLPKIRIVNLPTPILRTPTAVATGAGILLGSLLD
jgi:16S rRNA (uracil1498-N3)-methyltransferase